MAIALRGGGLVAPALMEADRKDLKTLMRDFSELVTRVRSGHKRSGEFTAATITVTSLGTDGAEVLYPIINPPQVAIVGAGASQRPWVYDGQLVIRPVMTLIWPRTTGSPTAAPARAFCEHRGAAGQPDTLGAIDEHAPRGDLQPTARRS